jgi:hypothetical protein
MFNAWGILCGKHTSHARMHLATVAMYSSPNLLVTVVKRITRLLTLTRGCPRHAWVLRMAWHLAITAWSQHAAQLRTTTRSCATNDRARRSWNTQCPCSGLDPIAATTDAYPSDARGNMHRKVVAQLHADLYRTDHVTQRHAAHICTCVAKWMAQCMRAHAHTHQCQDSRPLKPCTHSHTHPRTTSSLTIPCSCDPASQAR